MKAILPMPPSINQMYRTNPHGRGLYKTPEAKVWIQKCLSIIKKRSPFKGKVDVSIELYFQRDADIDNRLKPILDILQQAEVINNDRQIYSLVVTKFLDKNDPRVELIIEENN